MLCGVRCALSASAHRWSHHSRRHHLALHLRFVVARGGCAFVGQAVVQSQARLGRVKRDHEPMAVAAAMTAGARSYHKVKTQHQTGKHAQRAGKDPHAPRIGDPRETRRIWRLPKPTEVRPHDRRVVHRHLGRTFSQHEPKTTGAERIACSQPRTCWDAGKCATFARCRSHAARARSRRGECGDRRRRKLTCQNHYPAWRSRSFSTQRGTNHGSP